MEQSTDKKPIYDDRVQLILRSMVEGKTRDQLALELGHKSYKTLDIYMRRKNFMWDRDRQSYVPIYNRLDHYDSGKEVFSSSKLSTIISLFNKEDADAKTIAKRLGFTNHREMATYMKSKGYVWSAEKKNYQKMLGKVQEEREVIQDIPAVEKDEISPEPLQALPASVKTGRLGTDHLGDYIPLLELLDRNRDRLIDLIVPGSETGKVPRYAVPGIFVTKSVHMTNTLDQLVREYSKEKNISQRDIFAVALIEFFQRYGYEREMETLLGKR